MVVPISTYSDAMPTDRPTADDIELARILGAHGVVRAPRTCLRWRRRGVLIPPDGRDEDDRPIYSAAAIERALAYAYLLDDRGHDLAVVSLWGAEVGPGLPKKAVLSALRSWQTGRAHWIKQEIVRFDPDGPADQIVRRERYLQEELHRGWPAAADALAAHARRRSAAETEIDYAFDDGCSKRAKGVPVIRSPVGEVRKDLMIRTAEAEIEGEDLAAAVMPDLAEALGISHEVIEAIEAEGGLATIAERLEVIDACEKDDELFARLVKMRDVMRSAMLGHFVEIAEAFPLFAAAFPAVNDPELTGPGFALSALVGLTGSLRVEAAATGMVRAGDGTRTREPLDCQSRTGRGAS
jgi:hypothetical protein